MAINHHQIARDIFAEFITIVGNRESGHRPLTPQRNTKRITFTSSLLYFFTNNYRDKTLEDRLISVARRNAVLKEK